MRMTLAAPDFAKVMDGSEREIAGFLTAAMQDGTTETKGLLREQVTSAGLGQRLANTWRGKTYPDGRNSLDPSGYLWSNAPAIVAAYDSGAQVVPLAGKKYLWIPTAAVPRSQLDKNGNPTRRRQVKAGPAEVEAILNQDLIIVRGKRHLLAFIDAANTRNRGLRAAARARGATTKRQLVLMFTLVPTVRVAKRLDLQGAADTFTARWPALLAEHWR